jgi:hypothetical protein
VHALVIPLSLACLALVFYGSYVTHYVLVALSALTTFVSFYVTGTALLRSLQPIIANLTAAIIAVGAGAYAGKAASGGALTVPVLGFGFGAVAAGIIDAAGAHFAIAFPVEPALGIVSSRVCFGLLFARLASFIPGHAAAASTALCGARGFTACVAAATHSNEMVGRFQIPVTVVLACIGYATQAFFVSKTSGHDIVNRDGRHPATSLPYQQI